MTRQKLTTIWLVPSAEDDARIRRITDELADAQKGARYQPHMTLGSLQSFDPDLNSILGSAQALELTPIEIDRTDAFTMSLFVRFGLSPKLANLRAVLEAVPGFRASRAFDPHVSLCYGAPPELPEIDTLFSGILDRPIRFNRIWATEIEVPVETYAHIRTWRKRTSIELTGEA